MDLGIEGRVAMVTDEKIPWKNRLTRLYLIESGSYGGNSGSPVFFHLGSDRKPGVLFLGSPTIKLAGVMKGAFLDHHPLQEVETDMVCPRFFGGRLLDSRCRR